MTVLKSSSIGLLTLFASLSMALTNGFVVGHPAKSGTAFSAGRLSSSSSSSSRLYLFNFLNEGKKALVKKMAGDYDSVAVRSRMEGLVQDNPVLMLSFTTCPFCLKAKEVLDSKSAKYTVVELDQDPEGTAIRAELADMVGRTSVPALWIGKEFVGGCNDGPLGGIMKLNEQGKLEGMLQKVNAL